MQLNIIINKRILMWNTSLLAVHPNVQSDPREPDIF